MYVKCPICGSDKLRIEFNEIMGKYVVCSECGFDESSEYDDEYQGEKKASKGKGGSVYKRGGGLRTQKRR